MDIAHTSTTWGLSRLWSSTMSTYGAFHHTQHTGYSKQIGRCFGAWSITGLRKVWGQLDSMLLWNYQNRSFWMFSQLLGESQWPLKMLCPDFFLLGYSPLTLSKFQMMHFFQAEQQKGRYRHLMSLCCHGWCHFIYLFAKPCSDKTSMAV